MTTTSTYSHEDTECGSGCLGRIHVHAVEKKREIVNINIFQTINARRAMKWHDNNLEHWSLLEWAGALCGEAGEAANIAKKIRRIHLQLPNREAGTSVTEFDELKHKLAREIADVIIYGLIILSMLGVNASGILAEVFDKKSEEYGFPERAFDDQAE